MNFAHYILIATIILLAIVSYLRLHTRYMRDLGADGAEMIAHSGIAILMQCLISLVVLGCTLYIILSGHYDDGSQKWAFGAAGSIIGYWLKTS